MKSNWRLLSKAPDEKLHTAILQLHHLAQFTAMFGHAYLPHQADDSHNNLGWLIREDALQSHRFEKYGLSLDYRRQQLILAKDGKELSQVETIGRSKQEILQALRNTLQAKGFDPSAYQPLEHFSIPDLPGEQGATFPAIEKNYLEELAAQRHNAHLRLQYAAATFPTAHPLRIWPHHFDSGVYIPIEFDSEKTATKSISLGWAIPDEQITEPYYYVTHWLRDSSLDYDTLPDLPGGGYWNRKAWTGAVLPLSAIIAAGSDQQEDSVRSFLKAAINHSLQFLK